MRIIHVQMRFALGVSIHMYSMRVEKTERYIRAHIFERLSMSFLNARNRDLGEKLPSKSFSKWLFSHLLF